MMSGIRGSNTKPELVLRRGLHARGYRYRLHEKKLPGKPDLVLPKFNAVIFVNGCFWHGHGCHLFKWPQSREAFWRKKITGNMERDAANYATLHEQGWRICRIWECAVKGKARRPAEVIIDECVAWLSGPHAEMDIQGQ